MAFKFGRRSGIPKSEYAFLRRVDIFAGLPDEILLTIFEHSKIAIFPPRSIVFKEGDHNYDMYVIKSGVVEVVKETTESDKPIVVAYMAEGDCFGEMALITKRPRSATVRVPEKAKILQIPAAVYEKLMNENITFVHHMCEVLAMRLEHANLQMVEEKELKGKLEFFDLGTVIQALTSSGQTGVMTLTDGNNHVISDIVFSQGRIIKAHTGSINGEDAFFQIFQDNIAKEFYFQGTEDIDDETNVEMTTLNLLMESARLQDELKLLKTAIPDVNHVFEWTGTGFIWEDEETRDDATLIWKLIMDKASMSRILQEVPRCSFTIYSIIEELIRQGILKSPFEEDARAPEAEAAESMADMVEDAVRSAMKSPSAEDLPAVADADAAAAESISEPLSAPDAETETEAVDPQLEEMSEEERYAAILHTYYLGGAPVPTSPKKAPKNKKE